MNGEMFLLGLLSVLIVASNTFWAWVTYSLLNRLMSRTYIEYAQGKQEEKRKPQTLQSQQDVVVDPESERQAQELNSILNMV